MLLGYKNPKTWERRTCEACKQEFWFRRCYAKRPGRPGSFCSFRCHGGTRTGERNPNAGPLVQYGSKVVQSARTLRSCRRRRKAALDKLARIYGRMACINCQCDHYPALQVNHLKEFGTKQSGTYLWQRVMDCPDVDIKTTFDIRCVLCNWLHFVERKHNITYGIIWKGSR
jgi:hypothetical protein